MSTTRPPAFDDRFSTPIEASRRGAHRARPKPVSSGLPVIAGIAVVLLVIGGVYTVFNGSNGSSPGSGSTVAAGLDDNNDNPTSTGAAKVTSPSSAGKGGAVGNSSPTSQQTGGASNGGANAGDSGGVNRSISLVVLNSIAVQGLAKRVQKRLETAGWTVQRTGNSTNRNLATTKVYYGQTADKATAEALQADLGFGTVVKDSTVVSKGLSVVLGQDADVGH